MLVFDCQEYLLVIKMLMQQQMTGSSSTSDCDPAFGVLEDYLNRIFLLPVVPFHILKDALTGWAAAHVYTVRALISHPPAHASAPARTTDARINRLQSA